MPTNAHSHFLTKVCCSTIVKLIENACQLSCSASPIPEKPERCVADIAHAAADSLRARRQEPRPLASAMHLARRIGLFTNPQFSPCGADCTPPCQLLQLWSTISRLMACWLWLPAHPRLKLLTYCLSPFPLVCVWSPGITAGLVSAVPYRMLVSRWGAKPVGDISSSSYLAYIAVLAQKRLLNRVLVADSAHRLCLQAARAVLAFMHARNLQCTACMRCLSSRSTTCSMRHQLFRGNMPCAPADAL